MSKGLKYFQSVYKEVPDWIESMNEYNPAMLDAYTDIRGEAFKTNYLKDYEKDEIIAAVNAGRLYERSMILHTEAGFNKGSKLEDLIEYLLVAYVYKGIDELVLSLKAVKHYVSKSRNENIEIESYGSLIEVVNQLNIWTNNNIEFLVKISNELAKSSNATETREILMQAGSVSAARKQLCLVGMYLTELDGKGADLEVKKARELEVSDGELADLGYIVILTAGIPSWFELTDYIKKERGE